MRQTKRSAKGRRVKEAVPVLGAVVGSLSLAGGASAATAPAIAPDVASKDVVTNHEFALTEEEVTDVSLGTFFVFDKEGAGQVRGQQYARGCGGCRGCGGGGCRGCGGGRGCGGRGCGGCRGCGGGGCGCTCGCCLAWGRCIITC